MNPGKRRGQPQGEAPPAEAQEAQPTRSDAHDTQGAGKQREAQRVRNRLSSDCSETGYVFHKHRVSM